jgi:hypothetical protein
MVRAIGGKSRILILQVAKARLAAKAKLTLQPTLLQTTKAWGEPENRPRCRKNKKVKEREPKRREISLSVAGLRFPPSVKIFFDVGLRTSRQKREEASDEGTSCPEKKDYARAHCRPYRGSKSSGFAARCHVVAN